MPLRKQLLAAAALLLPLAAGAQSATCTTAYMGPVYPGTNAHFPFTAKVTQTFEQYLTDGNRIRRVTEVTVAHDSRSRDMWQHPRVCEQRKDGSRSVRFQVIVTDVDNGSTLSWEVGGNAGNIAVLQHHEASPHRKTEAQPSPPDWTPMQPVQPGRSEVKGEDLGTRTIAGMQAKGRRLTRTIPAGEEGNDTPIVTISEHWFGTDGLLLLRKESDPRTGTTTTEVTELTLGEPDPALFAPPAGYTIREKNPPHREEP